MTDTMRIRWDLVAEGDQLKSIKNGKFYPVTRTVALKGGQVAVTIMLGEVPRTITRPTPAEPMAIVRRGPTGAAVDVFVSVMSSG